MSHFNNSLYTSLMLIIYLIVLTHGITIIASQDLHDHHDHINYDPHRTAYHFQPPRYWMNDPNGPMIYNGIYHLFYQYYPHGALWRSKIVWGHSTSLDLINWTPQPIALTPSKPYDINGCWSGSTTILQGNKPAILYTGVDNHKYQVQNLAVPKNLSDPYLKEWIKVPQNPIMFVTSDENNINASSFRDPSTAWKLSDDKWRVIVGTQQDKRGLVVLFTSEDFLTWTETKGPFHSAEGTGVWECPDFYPVKIGNSLGLDTSTIGNDVKHVLKVGLFDTHYEYYTIGSYNVDKDIYTPDEGYIDSDLGLRYDYGKYYASKSFFDSKTSRRISWGWVNESSTKLDNIRRGWSGVQAIPRTIVLDKFGKQLVQWPIKEVETLRENEVNFMSRAIEGGSRVEITGVKASQADVDISFKILESDNFEEFDPTWTNAQILCKKKGVSIGKVGPFGLLTLASAGLEEYTAIFFRIFKGPSKYVTLMCTDPSRSSLNSKTDKLNFGTFVDVDPISDGLSLRILIDHSIVESFGANGKSVITARVYPTLAINDSTKLFVFNYGSEEVNITKLTAWSMKKAQFNLSNDHASCISYHNSNNNEEIDRQEL